jgi:hypothetical protein
MNILWATPWNSNSDAARLSAAVVESLRRMGAKVCVVTMEASSMQDIKAPTPLSLARYPFQVGPLNAFDVTVVNFADQLSFDETVHRFFDATPYIAIVHDSAISRDDAVVLNSSDGVNPEMFLLSQEVGKRDWLPGASNESQTLDPNRRPDPEEQYSFLQRITSKADIVLLHSECHRERLEITAKGKICLLRLPSFYRSPAFTLEDGLSGDRIILCATERFTKTEKLYTVIRAIALTKGLKDRSVFLVAGQIEDLVVQKLYSLADQVGLHGFRIVANKESHEIREWENESHVILCLRDPTEEAAFDSILDALHSGRPTILTSEMGDLNFPNGFVRCINPYRDVFQLAERLDDIFSNYPGSIAKASYAREWIEGNPYPICTAFKILEFCENLAKRKALNGAYQHVLKRASSFGESTSDLLVDCYNRTAELIFDYPTDKVALPPRPKNVLAQIDSASL